MQDYCKCYLLILSVTTPFVSEATVPCPARSANGIWMQLIWRSGFVFHAVNFMRYKRRGDVVTWRRDDAIHLDLRSTSIVKYAFERIIDVRVPNFCYNSQMRDQLSFAYQFYQLRRHSSRRRSVPCPARSVNETWTQLIWQSGFVFRAVNFTRYKRRDGARRGGAALLDLRSNEYCEIRVRTNCQCMRTESVLYNNRMQD